MEENFRKNTIKYVSHIEGKVNYDETRPIYKQDDLDAQLIHYLGNPDYLEEKTGKKFEEGVTFELDHFHKTDERNHRKKNNEKFILSEQNQNSTTQNDKVRFKIVKIRRNVLNGFTGAIIQRLDESGNAVETILWADGSKGFANILKHWNVVGTAFELNQDWVINNTLQIGSGQIFDQLRELKKFAEDYGLEKIDTGIGQSMMGIGMSALAVTKGYEDINFRAYSGTLREDLYKSIEKEWGLNDKGGSNLESYIIPQEPLTRLYKPIQLPNMNTYMLAETSQKGIKSHSGIAYFNIDGKPIVYYEITYNEDKYDMWSANPRLEYKKAPIGNGVEVLIKWNIVFDNGQKQSTEKLPIIIKYLYAKNEKLPVYSKANDVQNEEIKQEPDIETDKIKTNKSEATNSPLEKVNDNSEEEETQNTDDGTLTGGASGIEEISKTEAEKIHEFAQKYSDPLFMESYFSEVGEYGTLREKFKNGGSFRYDRNEKLEEKLPYPERELRKLSREIEKINNTLEKMQNQLYNCFLVLK